MSDGCTTLGTAMPRLPPSTQKIQQLQTQIDALPPGEMLRFPGPDQDMLLATGVLVQTYNYIELNLRRCVEAFVHANLLPESSWVGPQAKLLQSTRLVEAVKKALVRMTPVPADLQDWTVKLDEISLRWSMRHMFAHWALRRVPNEDISS
jgi:hypothetical protein